MSKPGKSEEIIIPGSHGPTYFDRLWAEYIHRIKVHQILSIMQEEQRKLKALQENPDLAEILLAENNVSEEERQQNEKEGRILYMKTLEEEKVEAEELAEETRDKAKHPDFITKSVLKLFKSKVTISERQFAIILSLCRDRLEQKQLKEAYAEKLDRDKYLHNAGEERRMLYEFLNSTVFNRIMLVLIFFSTAIIVLQTVEEVAIMYPYPLMVTDCCIIAVFILEAGAKITLYKEDYFRQVWNILDLIVIGTFFVEVCVALVTKSLAMNADINKNIIFKLLKSLRSLRLLRAIKFLPTLQIIVSTIFQSLLSLGSIAVLMSLFIFLFAVVGRGFFNEDDPIHFGNLWSAILTLFQLLTTDDWTDILNASDNFWLMFGYLFTYIILEFYVFLNLFVAVLVDNFQLALNDAEVGEVIKKLDWTNPRALGLDVEEDDPDDADNFDEILIDATGDYGAVASSIKIPPNQVKDHKHNLDLKVEDYFPVHPQSRDAKLIGENLKILNSIDFHNFLFVRRMKLMAQIMSKATAGKKSTWNVHDDTPDFGMEDDRFSQYAKTFEPIEKKLTDLQQE